MRRLVTAGALLVALTGCGQVSPAGPGGGGTGAGSASDGPAADATTDSSVGGGRSTGDVTLRAYVSVGFSQYPADPGIRRKPGIVVDYTLSNTGDQQLVAYDRAPEALGSAKLPADLDPEHALVYMDSGVVRVSKQGFGTAPGVTFVAAPVIGVRALGPGATLTGRAYAVSPPTLEVPGPDFDAPRDPVDPKATLMQFCVQVGERTAAMRPSSSAPDVLEGPVTAPGPDDLLCIEAVPLLTP
jgi:hypothetical protein